MKSGAIQSGFLAGRRLLRAALGSAIAAAAIAGCGGGSSTGAVATPVVPACASTALASVDGYALSSCASTKTTVFLDVQSDVAIAGDAGGQPVNYGLTLTFPAALQSLSGVTAFDVVANAAPAQLARDVVGALHGEAYENPVNATLTPPYVALTDFHAACCYDRNPPWQPPVLQYVGFGTWEKFASNDVNLAIRWNEGFLGVWYRKSGSLVETQWPVGALRVYRGYVVGVVGPDGSPAAALDGRYGFSAPIEIQWDGAGNMVAEVRTMTRSYVSGTQLVLADLPVNPARLVNASGASPGVMAGTVSSAGGAGADATGNFEAGFFGGLTGAEHGAEIAGRLRFRTTNGLVAVASFGAKLVP